MPSARARRRRNPTETDEYRIHEWPTSWLVKVVGEAIRAETDDPEEANQVFEAALDVLIPPEKP